MELAVINICSIMEGYNRLDHMRSLSDLSRDQFRSKEYELILLPVNEG